MKANTPIATETLRIVVARPLNSVLMFPSIALHSCNSETDVSRPRSDEGEGKGLATNRQSQVSERLVPWSYL